MPMASQKNTLAKYLFPNTNAQKKETLALNHLDRMVVPYTSNDFIGMKVQQVFISISCNVALDSIKTNITMFENEKIRAHCNYVVNALM